MEPGYIYLEMSGLKIAVHKLAKIAAEHRAKAANVHEGNYHELYREYFYEFLDNIDSLYEYSRANLLWSDVQGLLEVDLAPYSVREGARANWHDEEMVNWRL